MCVPFTGSEAWTRAVGYKIVDEWRAWTVNNQVSGYVCFYFLNKKKTRDINLTMNSFLS